MKNNLTLRNIEGQSETKIKTLAANKTALVISKGKFQHHWFIKKHCFEIDKKFCPYEKMFLVIFGH